MDKKEISRLLEEVGVLLELKGENAFKCNAYHGAARTIESMEGDLHEIVHSGRLQDFKGIGKALSEKITELVTTGRLAYYEELKSSVPPGLLEIIKLPGVGPKKAKVLFDKLGVASIGELEYAGIENRLVDLPGFGTKSQEKILNGIQYYKKNLDLHLLSTALAEAERLHVLLLGHPAVQRCSIAGSVRRRKEVIKDIDLVASSEQPLAVMAFFTTLPDIQHVIAHGETKSSILLQSGLQADLRVVPDDSFPSALHHFTGSKEHNTALRGRARRMGIKVNEYGLFRGEDRIPCRDEAELYAALDLFEIPPELREDLGEIDAAEKQVDRGGGDGWGGFNLIKEDDIQGVFHVHTTYSDGNAPLRDMVLQAKALGYRYIGISDHSRSAFYANGLSIERIREQHQEIDRLQEEVSDITIFKGIESDILADGSLDYPPEILATFDFVIGSVHSRFQMNETEMTERLLKALANPYITILGHPTGRLLLSREPYAVQMERIIEAAARYRVHIELNANPYRLDLDWRFCRYAKEHGATVCINPDAHRVAGLSDVRYGVGIARKGWLSRQDVFNTKPVDGVREFFNRKKEKI